MNPQFGYKPVGFIDDDPYNTGRKIHGVDILGSSDKIVDILERKKIDGVVLTDDTGISGEDLAQVIQTCQNCGIWVRTLRLEFELLD